LLSCDGSEVRPGPGATATTPNVTETVPGFSPSPSVFEPTDDVLTVAMREPSTLDPMRIQDPGSVLVARQLYEGLTRWDPELETVLPAAAQSWDVRNGGRTFVFRLRPGMTFHDGTPVTSSDFQFAFNRIALKENASDLAYTLELVQGFTQVNQLGDARHLFGIRTAGPLTLVIHLSDPFYELPKVLTHPGLVPVPARAVRNLDTFLSAPVGNGPFRIAEPWAVGQEVVLEAFPGFIDTPELDGIRFVPFPDAAASWLEFLEGNLHVAEVPAGQLEAAAQEFGEEGFTPLLAGYYYGVNVTADSLRDLRVRKTISRAIDRDTIASTVYRGTMVSPRGIVPAGMPGFQENICLVACGYSPDRARELARKVPRPRREATVEYNNDPPHRRVARLVADDLRAAGLRVRLRGFKFDRFLKRLRAGEHSMYRLGWIAEYPSPDAFLYALFHSDSPDNHSGFSSTRVDRLLDEARAERDEGRRSLLYRQAEGAIMRGLPIVPIGSFTSHWATQSEVRNIRFDVMGGFDAVEVTLVEASDEES
jgi:peptide/nickel transport system substrate-binding protein/oligopeptide transport system substrate-binding protein